MSLQRIEIAADARFWPRAAQRVVDFAARCGLPPRQLDSIVWIVPAGAHAALARSALRAALGAAAFLPPKITPLAAWLGRPLASGTAARAEIFAALRASRWVRESFGEQPAALWALAAGVVQLADELSWAAVGDADAFAGRLSASLERHFRRRAARAVQPQAQLVLQLWRARRDAGDGAAAALRELQALAEAATTPLVGVAGQAPGQMPERWQQAFFERYARRAPVLLIGSDLRGVLAERPLLAAAWPELAGGDLQAPLAARADAVRAAAAHAGAVPATVAPLAIHVANSFEDEAATVAQQVLDWRCAGIESIALVALDRLTARRARALLERAQVAVRDETGWKLSTTSAAAAVMRWYDLVADDLYWRDLLDWLKSSFTLAGRTDKAQVADAFERAIRAGGALQGARAIRGALAELAARSAADPSFEPGCGEARTSDRPAATPADSGVQPAVEVLALIVEQQQAVQRAGPTLVAHLRALAIALEALGMRKALAADPVGRCVLDQIEGLEAELAGSTARATLAEFRALLAARFEEVAFVDAQIDSPVVMVSLAAAALRPFDAALLIGADAQFLPAAPPGSLFMSNAVRAELGLATAESELRAQSAHLAALLATVPRAAAVWRRRRGDEPAVLSPLLQRLQMVSARAAGVDLLQPVARANVAVAAAPTTRPAPPAPRLPLRLSASEAQSLVDCPYRFYARRLLELAEPQDVIELPDKRDFGEALHAVLRRFHGEWGEAAFDALDAGELAASLRRHAEAAFAPLTARTPAMLAFHRRFDGLVDGYVEWLRQHAAQGWRWQAGEARRELPLRLAGGNEVLLHGRIDRIDTDCDGHRRVIDYKARRHDALRKALKSPGEDIQLPLYGLLLGGAQSAAYLSFDRARDEAHGVQEVTPPQPFDQLVDAVGERLRRDLQRLADGAPLPAIGAATVCAYCEMRGLCRRDYWEHGDDDDA